MLRGVAPAERACGCGGSHRSAYLLLLPQCVKQVQHIGDRQRVAPAIAILGEAQTALAVHKGSGWLSAELPPRPSLAIHRRNRVIGIGQAGKGQLFPFPVLPQPRAAVGSYDQQFGTTFNAGRVVVAQLRQMPAAVWSEQTAYEHHEDMSCPPIRREPHRTTVRVHQCEIGGR